MNISPSDTGAKPGDSAAPIAASGWQVSDALNEARDSGTPFAIVQNAATDLTGNLAKNVYGNAVLGSGITTGQAAAAKPQDRHNVYGNVDDFGTIDGAKGLEQYNAYLQSVGHANEHTPATLIRWLQDGMGFDSVSVDVALKKLRTLSESGSGGNNCNALYNAKDQNAEILTMIDRVYYAARGEGSNNYQRAVSDRADGSWKGMRHFLDDWLKGNTLAAAPLLQAASGITPFLSKDASGKPAEDALSLSAATLSAASAPAQNQPQGDIDHEVITEQGQLIAELERTAGHRPLEASDLNYKLNPDAAKTLRLMAAAKLSLHGDISNLTGDNDNAITGGATALGNELLRYAASVPSGTDLSAVSADGRKVTFSTNGTSVQAVFRDDKGVPVTELEAAVVQVADPNDPSKLTSLVAAVDKQGNVLRDNNGKILASAALPT